jgi:hypothetical protein
MPRERRRLRERLSARLDMAVLDQERLSS